MTLDWKSIGLTVTASVATMWALQLYQSHHTRVKVEHELKKKLTQLSDQLNDARREAHLSNAPSSTPQHPHEKKESQNKPAESIYRIALTGGPCAGKTTALTRVTDRLTSLGFRVYKVPEAASMLMTGGATPFNLDGYQVLVFQTQLLKIQMVLEDAYYEYAKASGQRSVIICDRGAMDGSAYMDKSEWQALLDENGWTTVNLRDKRYDAVLHLVTAANGAEKFYSSENNQNRSEDIKGALTLDSLLQQAWVGHPHFRIIDNSTDFEGKMHRVIESICSFVDLPIPVGVQKKYTVDLSRSDLAALSRVCKIEEFNVLETFIVTTDGSEAKVRRRGQNGSYTYVHSIRKHVDDQRLELKRPVNARIYVSLLSQADKDRVPVEKTRRCFLYKNQYFILDEFLDSAHKGLTVLRTEVEKVDQKVDFPEYLAVGRDVTGDKSFSSFRLARKDSVSQMMAM
eukprot:TRINITY_DN2884_c0_g1::TRINITY_DN2884_c0_g1_i1::g.5185::m.5185 TRINITY_DN2884_c0_g1::TRINITY_DN2884_c0_g1_i1::g.5185  ORF type:complete len:456 (-),score=136.99,sp/Q7K556/TTD14_DROME/38.27/3e-89,AAA_28/PF13521.1/1.9e-25,AAA_17/PF13207.1/0.0014,NTPase_1/PF03266.10/0.024,NTPase_1/PF03266.10/7.9e+02,Thymidylate_kin/PF02223.12/0.022,ArgK/PF03308.11/0.053,AAA_18/PF13238.1/0.12,AAA_19/PF13245.1/0.33 TRINITY_DN2884_c0_g1_i1:270-1637(-)